MKWICGGDKPGFGQTDIGDRRVGPYGQIAGGSPGRRQVKRI